MTERDDPIQRRFDIELAAIRRERAAALPGEALAWLALAPAWPVDAMTRQFPVGPGTMGDGPAVTEMLTNARQQKVVDVVPSPFHDLVELTADRESVLATLAQDPSLGAGFLRRELVRAAKSMDVTAGDILTGNPALKRWVALASRAERDEDVGRELEQQVEAALRETASGHVSLADALRWIETAEPMGRLFGGAIQASVDRSHRLLELAYRRHDDVRRLRNYYPRAAQTDAFRRLLSDGTQWALHFVGSGGAGKTMLIRHIAVALADEQRLAVARVDFDHLNPDYPRRSPGLLLMHLAEDLQLQVGAYAERGFRRFNEAIKAVNDRIRGAMYGDLDDDALLLDEKVRDAIARFGEALYDLDNRRPVLVLDTCEELAKIRPDGRIPKNVQVTFDILEAVHAANDNVRVVFSGRRPLPERSYLRVEPVGPLSEREAREFLVAYHVDDKWLEPAMVGAILEIAKAETKENDAPIYSPFDLDMYAGWAISDPKLDGPTLAAAGRHAYIRERIVGRLAPPMQGLVPSLAHLERFDRDLVQRLAERNRTPASVVQEVMTLEIMQPDRSGAGDVWKLDATLRARLLDYYVEEEPARFAEARRQLADVLRRETLKRDFSALFPEYFTSALDVLMDTPATAASWWLEVEQRIAREERWDWASEMIGTVKGAMADWPAERQSLGAAIDATQIAVQSHVFDTDAKPLWAAMPAAVSGLPTPELQTRVAFRAHCALGMLDQVREAVRAGVLQPNGVFDEQLAAAYVAALENEIEHAERSNRDPLVTASDIDVFGLGSVADPEESELSRELQLFSLLLWARLGAQRRPSTSANRPSEQQARFQVIVKGIESYRLENGSQRWLDWRAPDHLGYRARLEAIRFGAHEDGLTRAGLARDVAAVSEVGSIDADRFIAAWLLAHSQDEIVAESRTATHGDDQAVRQLTAVPRCNAHRGYPPLALVYQRAAGEHGEIEQAVAKLTELAQRADEAGRPDVSRLAHREVARIIWRLRLVSEDLQVRSGLSDSNDATDRALAAAARVVAGFPERKTPVVPDRLSAGDQALMRADFARPGDPARLEALEQAVNASSDSGDRVGHLVAAIALAIEHAQADRLPAALERLRMLRPQYDQQREHPPALPDWDELENAARRDPAQLLDTMGRKPIVWRPWVVRLLAVLVADHEPAGGARTMRLHGWITRNYSTAYAERRGSEIPPDLRFLASRSRPKPEAGPVPPAAPAAAAPVTLHEGTESAPADAETQAPRRSRLGGIVTLVFSFIVGAAVLWFGFLLFSGALGWAGITLGPVVRGILYWLLLAGIGLLPQASQAIYSLYVNLLRMRIIVHAARGPVQRMSGIPEIPASPLAQTLGLSMNTEIALPVLPVPEAESPRRILNTSEQRYALLPRAAFGEIPFAALHERLWIAMLDVELVVDSVASAAPWEAAIGLPNPDKPDFRSNRFRVRRVTSERKLRVREPWAAPVGVTTIQMRTSQSDRARGEWVVGAGADRFRFDVITGGDPKQLAGVREDVGILHIYGVPVETPSGLSLRIDSDTTGLALATLRPADLAARYPALRLGIIQAPPGRPGRRVDGDRREAALSRLIGAELFAAGIPAVLCVPSIPPPLADKFVELLGTFARSLPRRPAKPLLKLMRTLQEEIVKTGHDDREAALEIAFDVCLYLDSDLRLVVRSRERPRQQGVAT